MQRKNVKDPLNPLLYLCLRRYAVTAPAPHQDTALEPVPHETVASWPVGTFIENMAVLGDDRLALSIHNQRRLLRVDRDGNTEDWTSLPVSPAGLIAFGDGVLAVGGEVGEASHRVFQVRADGQVAEKLTIPGAIFLNGFTAVARGRAYTVDSLLGQIVEIDAQRWTCRVVFEDERLRKISDEPMLPGANGIKAGDGELYITNTDRALVLRASMSDPGDVTALDVLAEGLRGDDLALDDEGRLYITTHVHNTLVRLNRDGSGRVALAGPEQGMAGATACAFHPGDPGGLYVTTTGGLITPFEGVPQEAKLVRLEVRANGRPLPALG